MALASLELRLEGNALTTHRGALTHAVEGILRNRIRVSWVDFSDQERTSPGGGIAYSRYFRILSGFAPVGGDRRERRAADPADRRRTRFGPRLFPTVFFPSRGSSSRYLL